MRREFFGHSVAIGDLNGDRKPVLATANSDASSVSVLLNMPGLCTVQNVKGQTLQAAKLEPDARPLARAAGLRAPSGRPPGFRSRPPLGATVMRRPLTAGTRLR